MAAPVNPSTLEFVERRRGRARMGPGDKAIALALFVGVIILALVPFIFFAIRPGEVGVLYRLFRGGTETNFVFDEGIGAKWPWNRIYRYEVRTQSSEETIHGLAADGLSVDVDVTVLFHPIPDKAGQLHKDVGPNYVVRLVRPVTTEAVRDVIGKYGPHDLYRLHVKDLENQILNLVKKAPVGLVDYEGVIVRRISLPPNLNAAITRKLTEEQNAQAYDFLILQAEKEAQRKRVEAIGIQTFYSIVANALSPQLLTWRGIEATVQIARSPNSKVVIVGGNKDQLPLILGSDIANQPDLPKPAPVNPNANSLPDFNDLPRLFPDAGAATSSDTDADAVQPDADFRPIAPPAHDGNKTPSSPPSSGSK